MKDPHNELICIAATLARGQSNPFEDHGFYNSTPKAERRRVLAVLDQHNNELRELAVRLRAAADAMRAASPQDSAR